MTAGDRAPAPTVTSVVLDGHGEALAACARSLGRALPGSAVLVPATAASSVAGMPGTGAVDGDAGEDPLGVLAAAAARGGHVLVCLGPAVFRPGVLDGLVDALEDDAGVASISLLTPPALLALEPRQRGRRPSADVLGAAQIAERLARPLPKLRTVSVAHVVGPVVMLARGALSRVPFPATGAAPDVDEALRAWSVAAAGRAFCHLLDPSRPVDLTGDAGDPRAGENRALDEDDATRDGGIVVAAKLQGLRVLVDGRTLERHETGTEVQTVNLVQALARQPEVDRVFVNLRASVPPYADRLLDSQRVELIEHCGEWRDDLPQVDVVHRPYQPVSAEDARRWRTVGARTCCTVQDLITYLSPRYHGDRSEWLAHRRQVRAAVAEVDGVFAFSDYVRAQLDREGMRRRDEIWVAPCGTDHLLGGAAGGLPVEMPDALAGHEQHSLLVALGSDYGHKNLDLAVDVGAQLRAEGFDVVVALAGRHVRHGGVRPPATEPWVVDLGDNVSSAARNWLLAHARAVLCPTSAEGFGLVPFEAAQLGVPALTVSFGAVAEVLGELPVPVADWSAAAFAEAVRVVLTDATAAASQVEAIRARSAGYTWERTAATVVGAYLTLLSGPARA